MSFDGESGEQRDARILADLRSLIDGYGWAVRNVLAGATPEDVCFSYTIGFTAFGHPEVIVLGMPGESAQAFLNLIGDEVRQGTRFEHGMVTASSRTRKPLSGSSALRTRRGSLPYSRSTAE